MASISTQLTIVDGMSSPLNNIVAAVNEVIYSMQSVDNAIDQGFDDSSIDTARQAIDLTNAELAETLAALQRNTDEQENFNKATDEGSSAIDGMAQSLASMAAAYISLQGLQQLVSLSDTMTSTTARLDLIVDDDGSVDELQDKIFAVAQNTRASYTDTAATISKLGILAGDSFTSNDEILAFTELMNKNFVLGGASISEQTSAMYQLTQAMSAGVLQGDEYRSIIENAPLLASAIEDYMTNAGVTGTLKEWASEGLLTADVIKNAMFDSADEINAQFESMPMTWEQVWTVVCNELIMAAQPVLDFISFLAQNWSVLEPIVIGAAIALGAYIVVLGAYHGIQLANAIATAWTTRATIAQSIANIQAATTQKAFNAALLACPITWIILLIIAVIAAFYGVVAAINQVTGSTLSATGIICGALAVAGALIWNNILGLVNEIISIGIELYNLITTFANFFANVFNDPVGAIITLFSGMFDFILGIVQAAASLIDTVLGTDMAGAVEGFRNDITDKTAEIVGEQTVVMEKFNATDYQLSGIDYGDAWDAGYSFGEGVADTVGDALGVGSTDYTTDELLAGIESIDTNTSDIADSVAISEEDLQYLRDLAEQEAVNRFTTAEIKVEMGGVTNQVSSNVDLDGMVEHLAVTIEEAMVSSAEGVHA